MKEFTKQGEPLFVMLSIATGISSLLYLAYFSLAPYIWSFNEVLPPGAYTPSIRRWVEERDGVEVYALYAAMLINLLLTVGSFAALRALKHRATTCACVALSICGALFLVFRLGLNAPFTDFSGFYPGYFALMLSVAATLLLLWHLSRRHPAALVVVAMVLVFPCCFIATQSISLFDYAFIFSPGLRILKGFPLSEIYFQYDLLLSLMAAAWMRLGLDLNLFQVIGQASLYAFILGTFLLSRQLFFNKVLSVLLLITLVVVKRYGLMYDPVVHFQALPLRLDLWIIPVVMAFRFGVHHWSVALTLGALILVHKNFGMIYAAAYLELACSLFLVELADRPGSGRPTFGEIAALAAKHVRLNLMMLACCGAALVISFVAFGEWINTSAGQYRSLGIGFTRISRQSFYWYVPVVTGLCALLIVFQRRIMPVRYRDTVMFVALLSVGNAMYFFGRSHEHNILNISGILVLLFFVVLDLAGQMAPPDQTRGGSRSPAGLLLSVLPFAFVAVVVSCYSEGILQGVRQQFRNAIRGEFVRPLADLPGEVESIRGLTQGVDKVYFLSSLDFYHYYYGGRTPVGYFNPYATWALQADLIPFLQGLLDSGYLLVGDDGDLREIGRELRSSRVEEVGKYLILRR